MLFRCPTLTALQSRFAASFAALVFLGLIYWTLSNPHLAYAAELDVDGSGTLRLGDDHNWHRIEDQDDSYYGLDDEETSAAVSTQKPKRQAAAATAIGENNAPNNLNIEAGNTTLWVYPKALLTSAHADIGAGLPSEMGIKLRDVLPHAELRRRQDDNETTIFVSINTCLQPSWNGTGVQTVAPPQLTLYVASSSANTSPGPGGNVAAQVEVSLQEGFANASVPASGDWYMSVSAPALPEGFIGSWNYEIAVSIDDYYHAAQPNDPFLFLVDTDVDSALLVTNNLTQASASAALYKEWMALSTPFTMFAANVNHTAIMGIGNSYCGWKNVAQLSASRQDPEGLSSNVQMGMITRGLGSKPKEQFYVTNLNASSDYMGVLALDGNSTAWGPGVVGGGGKIWSPVWWTTKVGGNCALMFNLSFCDEVAYAVPSNPNRHNITSLRQLFDNYTSTYYQNFNYSLQQIPCNTTSDAQYSLAKGCDDCAAAYKEWLCAVSIPRCEDYSRTDGFLLPRNVGQQFYNNDSYLPISVTNASYHPMSDAPTLDGSPAFQQTLLSSLATNSSRNPDLIDQQIMPGPYKEVLPCEDLCWGLVQSCPASLGFGCPYPGRGLEAGYGKRSPNGSITCSYLGAVYDINAGSSLVAPWFRALALAAFAALILGVA